MDFISNISKFVMVSAITFSVSTAIAAHPTTYEVKKLVSDGLIAAEHTDPHLINPWGIGTNVTSKAVVVNNGSGTFSVYDGTGEPHNLVVRIPAAPSSGNVKGTPTGAVSNDTNGWVVSKEGVSWQSNFIFCTEDGTISGWAPRVDPKNAIIRVDNSARRAIYKGIARAANGEKTLLYVTNFRSGEVEVYDKDFNRFVVAGGFSDPSLPNDYKPYGIKNINGDLYVTFVKPGGDAHKPAKMNGNGAVDVFDANGNYLYRLALGGALNEPYGITLAPAGFGKFRNRILVANNGDGKINAYSMTDLSWLGTLNDEDNEPITIDGLWSIAFENGMNSQFNNVLYFTAGPFNGSHGLYGSISPVY